MAKIPSAEANHSRPYDRTADPSRASPDPAPRLPLASVASDPNVRFGASKGGEAGDGPVQAPSITSSPEMEAFVDAAGPDPGAVSGQVLTLSHRIARFGLIAALIAGAGSYRYLQTMPVGTGETRISPDGRFTASVMDWSERGFFTGTPRRWFRYRIEGPDVHHDVVGEPVPGPYFGSRSSHQVIRWSADSSAVEFVFPDTSIHFAVQPIGN